jgi:hypothetical protein
MAAIVLDRPWAGSSFEAPQPTDIGTIELALDTVAGVIDLNPGGGIQAGTAVSIGYSYAETVIATPPLAGYPISSKS